VVVESIPTMAMSTYLSKDAMALFYTITFGISQPDATKLSHFL